MRSYFDHESDSFIFLFQELRPTGEMITVNERLARTNVKQIFRLPAIEFEKRALLRYVVAEVGNYIIFWNPITSMSIRDVNQNEIVRVEKGDDIPDDVYEELITHFTNGEEF